MFEQDLEFDAQVYSADAVQRACYRFSDRVSSEVTVDEGTIHCRLFLSEDVDGDSRDQLVADLRNEVLDQVLRERVRAETADVRNLVFALAFSNTGLVEA